MKSTVIFLFGALAFTGCKDRESVQHEAHVPIVYTCPMHPQIIQDKPGKCPICKMDLVKKDTDDGNGSVMLTNNQIKLGNITTSRVRYGNVGNETVITGKVVINQDASEAVGSRANGRIERLFFKEEGQQILRGQPLYELYSEELMALAQEYLLTWQQYNETGKRDDQYRALLTAAKKKLSLYGLTRQQIDDIAAGKHITPRMKFLAPVSGLISKIDVKEGQYVEEGQTLYRIENLDNLWVEAELYANEQQRFYNGDTVEIEIAGFENEPVTGKVIFVNPEFNNGTQILPVRLLIGNPKHRFLPGMRARVFAFKTEKNVFSIPREAIIHDDDENYVWILNPDGSYSPRRVLTGLENDDAIEVRRGLEENENIVVTGAYLLYSELVLKNGGELKRQ